MNSSGKPQAACEILYGHKVSETVNLEVIGPDQKNSVHPQALRKLLKNRKNWIKLNPETLTIEQLSTRTDEPSRYLLTFDDGYKDNLTIALPIIEEADVPVIIFVTTEFIDASRVDTETLVAAILNSASTLYTPEGSVIDCEDMASKWQVYYELVRKLKLRGAADRDKYIDEFISANNINQLDFDREFLTWDDVRLLDEHPLVTIGAHSKSHASLTNISSREAFDEILGSKIELEQQLGHSIEFFSYPYGARSLQIDLLVRRAGFRMGFATEPRFLTIPWPFYQYRIPRVNISAVQAE